VFKLKQLTPAVLREATELIIELRGGRLNDEQLSGAIVRLDVLRPDPRWFSYAIDHVPELSAEQVVRRAFQYHPFLMPPPLN
jgi:hypothetical protein